MFGFQYKFVDVGIDFQARNFRQSLATPLENTKTTFTSPECPPELPTNCGFGKCAANAIECGLIRVSAGLKEIDFLFDQFSTCTRVANGNLLTISFLFTINIILGVPKADCERILTDTNINWLPEHMKNNLHCFCKHTLIEDQANNCTRQHILDGVAGLKNTLASKMTAIQSEYDSRISTLNSIDGALPEDFQNGVTYPLYIYIHF